MTECTKVLLILLFEHYHLITKFCFGKEPVDQHEVLPHIERKGIGLRVRGGT
jgi:hypothetical protein